MSPSFTHYLGLDYSGAQTPESSLKGLRLYAATPAAAPVEIPPPPGPRKYWTRQGLAHRLLERLATDDAVLVGIDHGFSFPIRYFETHGIEPDWDVFLDDFHRHWPTDEPHTYVDFVRDGTCGAAHLRSGSARWRRLAESRAGGAKSVFHFDVPGSVAKSTHAGLPWLRMIRRTLADRVHVWPFDGWRPPRGRSVIAEVYPSLWSRGFARDDRTADQHDAYSIAAWMRRVDATGELASFLRPELNQQDEVTARAVEGWILGVM